MAPGSASTASTGTPQTRTETLPKKTASFSRQCVPCIGSRTTALPKCGARRPIAMFRARCLFPLVAFCLSTLTMQAQDEMTATYIHHALEITVPYHGVHQGAGRLEVTLLSPEDKVLARSESLVKTSAANGTWKTELTPDHSISFEDIVWERVRSRVFFAGEHAPAMTQVRSVSTILRHPVVHLLGQTHYLAGSSAGLRVIVTDGTPNA